MRRGQLVVLGVMSVVGVGCSSDAATTSAPPATSTSSADSTTTVETTTSAAPTTASSTTAGPAVEGTCKGTDFAGTLRGGDAAMGHMRTIVTVDVFADVDPTCGFSVSAWGDVSQA